MYFVWSHRTEQSPLPISLHGPKNFWCARPALPPDSCTRPLFQLRMCASISRDCAILAMCSLICLRRFASTAFPKRERSLVQFPDKCHLSAELDYLFSSCVLPPTSCGARAHGHI